MVIKISRYDDEYDEDYNEIEHLEGLEDNGECEQCGQPLKYHLETDEIFGRIDCYRVYYCPDCDT